MKKYHITYETLGRKHDLEQDTEARDADELASKIFYFARKHLASKNFEVLVNLDTMQGSVEYGRFGKFAIEVRS